MSEAAPAVPTTTSQLAVVQRAASEPGPGSLDPMLLVAGVVVAVATLCLLLIGSRPQS